MSIQFKALFFILLSQSLFGYEFTYGFPDEENVQLDLFFSARSVNKGKIEHIVLSDIYYTIAYQEIFEDSSIEMVPHFAQIIHTSRVEQPYEFRLTKVSKADYPRIRSFWQKLQELSKIGPTKEEIDNARQKLRRMVDKFQQHARNIQTFIKRYQQILNEVDEEEIQDNLSTLWVFNDLKMDYKIQPLAVTLASHGDSSKLKLANTTSEYFHFEISDVDKEYIYEIIHTMGTNGLFSLLRKKNHLQSLGKKIHHVEPLQLLAYVVTNPTLKHDMREVQRNTFKWINFIDGLSKPIMKQWREGSLQSQLPAFAHLVGKNVADLQRCLDRGKVDEFVIELIR